MEPTRVTINSSTLIDLINYVIRKFNRPKDEPKTIKVRSYKNFQTEHFL